MKHQLRCCEAMKKDPDINLTERLYSRNPKSRLPSPSPRSPIFPDLLVLVSLRATPCTDIATDIFLLDSKGHSLQLAETPQIACEAHGAVFLSVLPVHVCTILVFLLGIYGPLPVPDEDLHPRQFGRIFDVVFQPVFDLLVAETGIALVDEYLQRLDVRLDVFPRNVVFELLACIVENPFIWLGTLH